MLTFLVSQANEFEEAMAGAIISDILSLVFGIIVWVLTSLSVYTFAKRRGIRHAWLSWFPVINVWIIGSLSDQYRYVARGQVKNKRKALLTLTIILIVLWLLVAGLCIAAVTSLYINSISGVSEEEMFASAFGPLIGSLCLLLPMLGIAIAQIVIQYMALYDIYMSCNPENAVMFEVLSIFFNVTTPFFLFFNRKSDRGMVRAGTPGAAPAVPAASQYQPPQASAPEYQAPQACAEYQPPQASAPEYQAPQTSAPQAQQPEAKPQNPAEPWDQVKSKDPWEK